VRLGVREVVVDHAKPARARALRAQHPVAIEALRPMRHIPLGVDAARAAIGRDLLHARARQAPKERFHLFQ